MASNQEFRHQDIEHLSTVITRPSHSVYLSYYYSILHPYMYPIKIAHDSRALLFHLCGVIGL